MAREIIITGMHLQPDGSTSLKWVFWLTVPTNLQSLYLNGTSSLPASTTVSWGITPSEAAEFTTGALTEQGNTGIIPASETVSAVGTYLLNAYTAAQTALNATAPTLQYIGTYYDSSLGWQNLP